MKKYLSLLLLNLFVGVEAVDLPFRFLSFGIPRQTNVVPVELITVRTQEGTLHQVPKNRFILLKNLVDNLGNNAIPVPVPMASKDFMLINRCIQDPCNVEQVIDPIKMSDHLSYFDYQGSIVGISYTIFLNQNESETIYDGALPEDILKQVLPNTRNRDEKVKGLLQRLPYGIHKESVNVGAVKNRHQRKSVDLAFKRKMALRQYRLNNPQLYN